MQKLVKAAGSKAHTFVYKLMPDIFSRTLETIEKRAQRQQKRVEQEDLAYEAKEQQCAELEKLNAGLDQEIADCRAVCHVVVAVSKGEKLRSWSFSLHSTIRVCNEGHNIPLVIICAVQ